MSEIYFFSEDIEFTYPDKELTLKWLINITSEEGKTLTTINYIFCSDNHLHKLNKEYLHHDTLTDIITFPYGKGDIVEGDIFISIERVRENAKEYKVLLEEEVIRVMAHGVLHMCGYKDKTMEDQSLMRQKEDQAIVQWKQLNIKK